MHNPFDLDKARRILPAPEDPGFVYLMRDRGRLKLGKTKTPENRVRTARTWCPDIEIIAMKPFWHHHSTERYIHVGLAMFHYKGEWFDFDGDAFEDSFIEEFQLFGDDDALENNLAFPYFINGSGMAEFTLEWSRRGISKRKFLINRGFS